MKMLRLVSESPVSNGARLMMGDVIIPFYEATINLAVGEFATITIVAPIEGIDTVVGLEHADLAFIGGNVTPEIYHEEHK